MMMLLYQIQYWTLWAIANKQQLPILGIVNMYIIITEFGEIFQAETITQNEKMACDSGDISIVNTEDMTEFLRSYDKEWQPLEKWDN